MRAVEGHPAPLETNRELRWGSVLLGLVGALFALSGLSTVYRGFFTDQFEPGVDALGGVTGSDLAASNPEMASYIAHLHVNGGILAALVGGAIVTLVWFGVRRGQRWSLAATVTFPVVYLVFLAIMHVVATFDYHLVEHLAAVGIGLPVLALGAALSYSGMKQAEDHRREPAERGG